MFGLMHEISTEDKSKMRSFLVAVILLISAVQASSQEFAEKTAYFQSLGYTPAQIAAKCAHMDDLISQAPHIIPGGELTNPASDPKVFIGIGDELGASEGRGGCWGVIPSIWCNDTLLVNPTMQVGSVVHELGHTIQSPVVQPPKTPPYLLPGPGAFVAQDCVQVEFQRLTLALSEMEAIVGEAEYYEIAAFLAPKEDVLAALINARAYLVANAEKANDSLGKIAALLSGAAAGGGFSDYDADKAQAMYAVGIGTSLLLGAEAAAAIAAAQAALGC